MACHVMNRWLRRLGKEMDLDVYVPRNSTIWPILLSVQHNLALFFIYSYFQIEVIIFINHHDCSIIERIKMSS